MRPSFRSLAWCLAACLTVLPAAATAQTGDNVLVIINEASPASVQIGEYYARLRSVPVDQVVRVKTVTTDTIQRVEYERTIEMPVGVRLVEKNLTDKVLYIVLTKGVPLRVAGTEGRAGAVASVDSELTLLYRKLIGTPVPLAGQVNNPYFLDAKPISDAKPFTRFLMDIYLVTRLDGFTVEDVTKLIDRGLAPTRDGRIVLDQKATYVDRGGDQWLQDTADRLRAAGAGDRVVLEMTRSTAASSGPVMGYYSWGSNDPTNKLRHFGLSFAPGAIGGMFVSTDGRTFTEPPADWVPNDPKRPGFGSQSLAGDLIRDGITGVAAHVAEPYLDATIRPQVLFPAYLAGFNLAEAFYLGMPFLSWQTVVIGDPLCAPFPRKTLAPDEIARGLDPVVELPALYVERRVAALQRTGFGVDALKQQIRAEAQIRLGNTAEAQKAFLRATELEPKMTTAQLALGSMFDQAGEYEKAIERYRTVLTLDPQNPIALNNLAYGLAVHLKQPKDALTLAERAYALTKSPVIGDTLGWIHHLLGNDEAALPLVDRAVAALKDDADVLVHAAVVRGALGDLTRAKTELDAAEKIDPKVATRPEVIALRARIKGGLEPEVAK
jgi:uncharacterized protein (TIGR03790 family)